MLDLGQRKTTFLYWQNGRPAYLRPSRWMLASGEGGGSGPGSLPGGCLERLFIAG